MANRLKRCRGVGAASEAHATAWADAPKGEAGPAFKPIAELREFGAVGLAIVVIPAGFEPATLCLEGRCSIRLSYGISDEIPVPAETPAHSSLSPGALGSCRAGDCEYMSLRRGASGPLAGAASSPCCGQPMAHRQRKTAQTVDGRWKSWTHIEVWRICPAQASLLAPFAGTAAYTTESINKKKRIA